MSLANPFDFTGKTVVLAGATGGLGHPISVAFAAARANLACCARSEPALAELANELKGSKGQIMTAKVDLCVEEEVNRFVENVRDRFKTIDVLNNPQRVEQIMKRMPLGKLLPADSLVGPTLILASDAARWINGHTINVDTGFNIT